MPKVIKDYVEGKSITLQNKEVRYVYLDPLNPLRDEEYEFEGWKLNIMLDHKAAKALQAQGFNVKHKELDDGSYEYWVIAKKRTNTKAGKVMKPPVVYDRDNSIFKKPGLIGNGTIVNIQVFCKYIKKNKKVHLPMYINALQVVKFKEYTPEIPFDVIGEASTISEGEPEQNTGFDAIQEEEEEVYHEGESSIPTASGDDLDINSVEDDDDIPF